MGDKTCIDYVEFNAIDLVKTKKFYGNAFGWTFTDYGAEYTAFSESGLEGGFSVLESNEEIKNGALIVLYHTDLKAIRENIVELGGKIVKEIFSFPGGRRFHFTDPSGNELAVWSDK